MDIAELERFALGEDREVALERLVPGTVDHDYWRGVLFQHQGRLDDVDRILVGWSGRHGASGRERYERLWRRQLLLRAEQDFGRVADDLRVQGGVAFDDRPEVVVQEQRFPSALDPSCIDAGELLRREVHRHPDLATVTDEALPDVVGLIAEGDASRRRSLLKRLRRADVPGVLELVAADLEAGGGGGFGGMAVHGALTLAQLEELGAKRPAVRAPRGLGRRRLTPPSAELRTCGSIATKFARSPRASGFS